MHLTQFTQGLLHCPTVAWSNFKRNKDDFGMKLKFCRGSEEFNDESDCILTFKNKNNRQNQMTMDNFKDNLLDK